MAGLPFTALPASTAAMGQTQNMPGPASLDSLTADRRTRAITQGTPLIEVAPTQALQQQPDITTTDPAELAVQLGEMEKRQLTAFDKQIAAVKVPIQQELDTSYKQYEIDVAAIRGSGLDQAQQQQRINQMNAQYAKKWVSIKSKLEPQVNALQQAKASAQHQMTLSQAMRMKEIQTYASLAEQGVINEESAKTLQFKALGIDVPVTAFRPAKYQSPYEVVQRNRQMMSSVNGLLSQFRVTAAKDRWLRSDVPEKTMVLKPRSEWADPGAKKPSDRDYRDATPDEVAQYQWALGAQDRLRSESRAAAEQLIGRKVADLSGAVGPLASGVRSSMPRSSRKTLTTAEVDALLDESGGDPQRAEQLARARGYQF